MPEDPEAPIDASGHLRMLPVLSLADPALVSVVLAGARRAGEGPAILIVSHADEAVLIAARAGGVEVVVIVSDAATAVGSMNAARRLGGHAVPVLALATRDGSPHVLGSCLELLTDETLFDVNVPVPAVDDHELRTGLWDELRAARLEERHHLVEVDGAPALAELASVRPMPTLDPWASLAAGAAGVLAGRMAAGNRRWRRQLDT
jgi:hypothetical protein